MMNTFPVLVEEIKVKRLVASSRFPRHSLIGRHICLVVCDIAGAVVVGSAIWRKLRAQIFSHVGERVYEGEKGGEY